MTNLFKHKGREVCKGGLSDGCGSLFKTYTKAGQREVITVRHKLNLRDLPGTVRQGTCSVLRG